MWQVLMFERCEDTEGAAFCLKFFCLWALSLLMLHGDRARAIWDNCEIWKGSLTPLLFPSCSKWLQEGLTPLWNFPWLPDFSAGKLQSLVFLRLGAGVTKLPKIGADSPVCSSLRAQRGELVLMTYCKCSHYPGSCKVPSILGKNNGLFFQGEVHVYICRQ